MGKPPQVGPLGAGKYVRMALIAKSGFGKTVFCGTAPKALFITTDPEGTVSAHGMGSEAEEWQVKSWAEINDAYKWLRDEGLASEGYEWIIVDNVTEAQAFAMKESLEIAVKKNSNRDPYVPDKYEYQRSQNATIEMVKKFNELPVNIIYTSHRKGMEDGDGQDYYSAAIQGQQGQVAEQILGYMNIIAFGEVTTNSKKEEVRRYYFTHHNAYRGKCRFVVDGKSVLGAYKDDLTVEQMMRYVALAKKKAATQPAGTRRTATKTASARRARATK